MIACPFRLDFPVLCTDSDIANLLSDREYDVHPFYLMSSRTVRDFFFRNRRKCFLRFPAPNLHPFRINDTGTMVA